MRVEKTFDVELNAWVVGIFRENRVMGIKIPEACTWGELSRILIAAARSAEKEAVREEIGKPSDEGEG